jgi:hypothetical protein
MIEALLVVDTADPFERLSPFFSREILARPGGARIAADVLTTISGKLRASAHEVVKMLAPDSAPRVRMGEDPRWVDLLVGLLADALLRPLAKHVLATVVRPMSPMAVEASYRRVAGPKIKAPAPPPLDETKVDAAKGEAESWALRLRATLEDALARMKRAKYGPRAKGKAVGGVDRVVTEGQIAEIEKLTRTRLPEMVRALYLIVGPIDFQGEFQRIDAKGAPVPIPAGLEAFRASPRLLIQPLSRALAGLKRRLREQTGVPVPLRDPLCLDLGEDLAVRVDVWRLDPPLEGSDETLGAHLRAHRGVEDPGARGLRRAYLGKAQGSTRLSRRGVSSA